MRKKIFLVCGFLLILGSSIAQADIKVAIDKSKLALNETFRLSVTVRGSGNISKPIMPDLSAFNVYSSGQSKNVSFINGQMSSSISYNYNLMPKSTGKFTIAPFKVTVNGQAVQSQPFTIEVVAVRSAPSVSAPSQATSKARGAFAKLEIDRKTAYVNQEVILKFKFYYRVSLLANPDYVPPKLAGFLYEDLPPPRNFNETVQGVQYRVHEIKTALFPTQPGKIVIPPAQIKIAVQDFSRSNSNEFFSLFFRGGAKEHLLITDPVKLEVFPLPKGKPSHFSNGVGRFGITASLDKSKLVTGEPVTLTIAVSGTGNISSLGDPSFPDFPGFRKYDTVSSLNIDKSEGTVKGSKTYSIVLFPQASGSQKLAPITFSYFNLKEKKYKTLKTFPIEVQVQQGQVQSSPAIAGGTNQIPSIKKMQEEIRFIKTSGNVSGTFKRLSDHRFFFWLNIIPLCLLVVALLNRIRQNLLLRNPQKQRMSRAFKRAKGELKNQKPMEALKVYLSDKMLGSEHGMTRKEAQDFLEKSGAKAETLSEVGDLWSDLEMAHYAPSQMKPSDLGDLVSRTKKILKKLEKTVAVFFIFILGSVSLFSQEPDSFEEGNRLYQEGTYFEAAEKYQEQISETRSNPVLEYNLGNAHYQSGAIGKALVHWQRAYRMNPSDSDIRFNIQFVSKRSGDAYFSEVDPLRWLQILLHMPNLNILGILWLLILWTTSLTLAFTLWKKTNLFELSKVSLLAGLIVIGGFFLFRLQDESWTRWAIVTEQKAEVRAGPGDQFPVGFTVPEGRRVKVLDDHSLSAWVEIAVPKEGLRGWVPQGSAQKI